MQSLSTLKIQYLSDLHIDVWKKVPYEIVKSGDILVLAGDIGNIRIPIVQQFYKEISNKFNDIVLIYGNHEYYQNLYSEICTMDQYEEETKNFILNFPNIHLLQKETWVHSTGIEFYGCTLWDNIPEDFEEDISQTFNDFFQIFLPSKERFSIKQENIVFADHFKWLEEQISKGKACVVVTHHVPFNKHLLDHILNDRFDLTKVKFFESLIKPNVKLWICGHMHTERLVNVNNIPIVLNAIGYPKQRYKVNLNKTYDIIYSL